MEDYDLVIVKADASLPEYAGKRGVILGESSDGVHETYYVVMLDDEAETIMFPERDLIPTGERTTEDEIYNAGSVTVAVDEEGRGEVIAYNPPEQPESGA